MTSICQYSQDVNTHKGWCSIVANTAVSRLGHPVCVTPHWIVSMYFPLLVSILRGSRGSYLSEQTS